LTGASSYSDEVWIDYEDLVRIFGEATFSGDEFGKTQKEWVVKFGSHYFRIYDYKNERDFEDIREWHIGSWNVRGYEVTRFIQEIFTNV
jgi:hypothetical protein